VHIRKLLQINRLQKAIYGRLSHRWRLEPIVSRSLGTQEKNCSCYYFDISRSME